MSLTDYIVSGTLSLGQDVSWQGQSVFTDFCLYTDESSESSRIVDVDFQLEGIVDYAAIKLFMFQRHRWKAGIVESNNVLYSFLNGLFEEGTNISTTTKRALIISVNKVNEEELYPFSIGNRCIIYGERLNVYVHPIYNDHEFLPIYEPSTVHPNEKDIQPVLHEIFGDEFDINSSAMISSAQLSSPKNQRNEIELIRDLNHNSHGRDLLSEFKLAVEEKKKQQQKQRTLTKSKPTKIVSTTTLLEEKKIVVKKLIKEALSGSVKEDKSINQLIYSSIRYTYRHVLTSSKPLDENKLKCIIKLHTDFYNNLDTIVHLFHDK